MSFISRWIRLWQIQRAILRHGLLAILIKPDSFLQPLAKLSQMNVWYWRSDKNLTRGARLRLTLQELGPFFIKFGQLLSTRRDILPDDIAEELAKLQDQVAPFTKPDVHQVVSAALGQPISEVMNDFNPIPLASASIAQVHSAVLFDGKKIVLKILRPDIEKIIENDVYWLQVVARRASRYVQQGARLTSIVDEIEQTIYSELDLLREGANASQLKRNLSAVPDVHIPEIIWPLSHKNLLVMEHIHGIPFTDLQKVRASGVDLKILSEKIIHLFFTQVFEHGFFHADLHAGNLFLSVQNETDKPAAFQIIMVDFGIIGVLNKTDLSYLAENLNAFLNHDYQRIAELHIESGWVPRETRPEQFASSVRAVCEPLLAQPLKNISFGHVLLRLLQTASAFNMEVQPQLILLQKTLINVEGLTRQLYPDVDFFKAAEHSVKKWKSKHSGASALWQELQYHTPRLAAQLPVISNLMCQYLSQAVRPAKSINAPETISKSAYYRGLWTGIVIAGLVGAMGLYYFG